MLTENSYIGNMMSFSVDATNVMTALGGAVLGSIITGSFALYIAKRSKDKKEVVVSTSSPSRLLVVHDQISSDVEILVSGNKVDNVILSEIFISNSGNKTVENLNFPVTCQDSVRILSVEALDQAAESPRVGSVVTKKSNQEIAVDIDYINPGEEISLRCIVSGAVPRWNVLLRQPELNVVRREQPVASYSDVVTEIVFRSLVGIPILSTYLRLTSPAFKKFLDHENRN